MTGSSREFYGTGTNFLRYRYRYFFPGPIFSCTGTGTFFRDQIFSVPVLFSGTNFFRDLSEFGEWGSIRFRKSKTNAFFCLFPVWAYLGVGCQRRTCQHDIITSQCKCLQKSQFSQLVLLRSSRCQYFNFSIIVSGNAALGAKPV